MQRSIFHPIKKHFVRMALVLLLMGAITACSGAPMEEIPAEEEAVLAEEAAPVENEEAFKETGFDAAAETAEEAPAEASDEAEAPAEGSEISPIANAPNVSKRLIIKNAELELVVEDTDTTINRALGIVTEYRGYVVSNRTWFSSELKYATLSIGVPAENFEEMLRRLKDLAVSVTNETVSGQDVTDEFVDLEARLRNLEATAARIRDFLDQAGDVEESLQVSNQLSEIEAQIEQVKGRMAYLKDRSAFSTITLQISPRPPQPVPSPTPSPTPTPVPWSVNQSIDRATGVSTNLATTLFQVSVELIVWFVVVILPFALPVVGLIWLGLRMLQRIGLDKTTR